MLQSHQLRSMTEQLKAAPETPFSALVIPAPKVRKKRNNEESRMQQALIRWWNAQHRAFNVPVECLFAIPNGMRKGAIIGSILKREGVRAGVPDLMLATKGHGGIPGLGSDIRVFYSAMFLELKTPKGVIAPEQRPYHAILAAQGYKVVIVRSLNDGINEITTYLT